MFDHFSRRFFQNYPLNQHYHNHQFCHFSTAKIPSWYMAFIRKMVFQGKCNASPINLWIKILGQFKLRVLYNWKHLRYLRDLRPLNWQLCWWIQESSLRTADVSPRSSPLRDVSWGGTSATQRQKFHTDDVKSVRNPVRSANWSTE